MSHTPIMKQARLAESKPCAICGLAIITPTAKQKVHAGKCVREWKIRKLRDMRRRKR